MMHPPRVAQRAEKSLNVRFPVPRDAAMILRSMAMSKDPRLTQLGVLAVKFKDDDSIMLGLDLEKDPWSNGAGYRQSAQRRSTSDILSPFGIAGVKVLPSDPDRRHNTAGKHTSQDVIYAGNGLCKDINYKSAERKSSQLNARKEWPSGCASETRSSGVMAGIRPKMSSGDVTRKQCVDLKSPLANDHSNGVTPVRILSPPSRLNKKDCRSPGLPKSASQKRGGQPQINMFFDKGQFSAANMLMQLAKNHSSKEGDEEEGQKAYPSSDDSSETVLTNVLRTDCPNKASTAVTQPGTPSENSMGSRPVVKPSGTVGDGHSASSGHAVLSDVHLKREHVSITSTYNNLTATFSQRGPVSTLSCRTVSHSASSSFHTLPSNLVKSKSSPATTHSTLVGAPVLNNSQMLQVSSKQTPKGSADTRTTWSNPTCRVRPHSQPDERQTSKSMNGNVKAMPGSALLSGPPTTDQSASMGFGVKTTNSPAHPGCTSNTANVQNQLGQYQQSVARYPVGYFTYPLGFVYPYIAVPPGQSLNTASGKGDNANGEEKNKEHSDIGKLGATKEPPVNPVKQDLEHYTRAESRSTSNVQWVIPQVQAGNIQSGQFIDLASSLRYWQQLSLLYRNQFQVAAAHTLAGLQCTSPEASSATSSQPNCPQNPKVLSDGKDNGEQDLNNNVADSVRHPKDTKKSQGNATELISLSRPSVSEKESHPVDQLSVPVHSSDVIKEKNVWSTAHLASCQQSPTDACTRSLSEKPFGVETKPRSPQSWSSSCGMTTSSGDDPGSPSPDLKDGHSTPSEKQESSVFRNCHPLSRDIKKTAAPELSFVHENSIEYMNVRTHCDIGPRNPKKAASRSEECARPAKRRKSKKSL